MREVRLCQRARAPCASAGANLTNDFNRRGHMRPGFGHFGSGDSKAKVLIQPNHFRSGTEHQAILRLQLDRLLALESDLLDRKIREIVGVTIMRDAENPVPKLASALQFPRKSVHSNSPNVKWNWIEPRVFLVCRRDRQNNVRHLFGQPAPPWNDPRQQCRTFRQRTRKILLLKSRVNEMPPGKQQKGHNTL